MNRSSFLTLAQCTRINDCIFYSFAYEAQLCIFEKSGVAIKTLVLLEMYPSLDFAFLFHFHPLFLLLNNKMLA